MAYQCVDRGIYLPPDGMGGQDFRRGACGACGACGAYLTIPSILGNITSCECLYHAEFPFFLCPPGKCPPPGPPLGGKAARAKQPSGASAAPGACAWPLCTAGASFGFWPGGGGGRRPRKIQPLMPSVLWARPLYGLHVLIHTVHAMHCHVLPQG